MAAHLLLFRGATPYHHRHPWPSTRNAIYSTSLTASLHLCPQPQPPCIQWRHTALRNGNIFCKAVGHDYGRVNSAGFDEGHAFEPASKIDVDKLLAVAEVVCMVPPLVLSVGWALQSTFQKTQNVYSATSALPLHNRNGNMYIGWQILPLLGAVIISAVIRTRQWRKITRAPSEGGGSDISLIQRVKKLEEDVGSSVTIIRVLSRQLEKLGVRFRVTRQTLRDPINQTAALAQKTSEAVRVLAMQEDALENELREIQHILLSMQEQQQKLLELVLTLAKVGRLQEKPTHSSIQDTEKPDDSTGYSGRKRTNLKGLKEHKDMKNLANDNFVQKPGNLPKGFAEENGGISNIHYLPNVSKAQLHGSTDKCKSPKVNNSRYNQFNNTESQILSFTGQAEINLSQIPEVQGTVQDIRSKSDFAASNSQEKNDNLNSNTKEKLSAEGSGLEGMWKEN